MSESDAHSMANLPDENVVGVKIVNAPISHAAYAEALREVVRVAFKAGWKARDKMTGWRQQDWSDGYAMELDWKTYLATRPDLQ